MGQIAGPETLVFNLNQFIPLKMGQIAGPETLVFNLKQTPGYYPKADNLNTVNHGESLKFHKQ